MNKKLESVKTWLKDPYNRARLYTNTFVVATIGGTVALFVVAVREQNKAINEYNESVREYAADVDRVQNLLVEEHNLGKLVYALNDGSFLSLDKDTNPQIIR